MAKENKIKCPECGSDQVKEYDMNYLSVKREGAKAKKQEPDKDKIKHYLCWKCEHKWKL